jgi:hypothetical protein
MAVSAVLRPGSVTVDPGRTARCRLFVRNTGQVVDQFALSIAGEMAGWATLKPDQVNLLPNEEAVVELVVAPPMTDEVLAGDHPFAIRVRSREDVHGSMVHEGMATVTKFVRLTAEIVPQTSRGRLRGRHTLAVDNLGNFPLMVEAKPTDPDTLLNFKVRPEKPVTEPGTATMIRIRPRPVKTFWRGPARNVPFRVDVVPATGKSLSVAAALNHRPLLPRALMMLVLLLLLLTLLLVLILTTLLERQPELTAGPAPSGTAPAASSTASAGASATGSRPRTGASGAGAPGSASHPASPGTTKSGTGTTSAGPAAFTIDARAYPGSPKTAQLFSYVIPAGDRMRLYSVRLTDSHADSGSLRILLGHTTLASFNLTQVHDVYYLFSGEPVAKPGQPVTIAVSCADPASVCSVTGAFSRAGS